MQCNARCWISHVHSRHPSSLMNDVIVFRATYFLTILKRVAHSLNECGSMTLIDRISSPSPPSPPPPHSLQFSLCLSISLPRWRLSKYFSWHTTDVHMCRWWEVDRGHCYVRCTDFNSICVYIYIYIYIYYTYIIRILYRRRRTSYASIRSVDLLWGIPCRIICSFQWYKALYSNTLAINKPIFVLWLVRLFGLDKNIVLHAITHSLSFFLSLFLSLSLYLSFSLSLSLSHTHTHTLTFSSNPGDTQA